MSELKLKLKGGVAGSVANLKTQLKRGSTQFFTRIGDEPLLVRFLTEPDEWVIAFLHFDADVKMPFPCNEDECPGCASKTRRNKVFMANAVDVAAGQTIPLQMPTTVAKALLRYYDKYGTITDRDYELSREGEGLNTEYSVMPEGMSKINVDRYEQSDLWDMLVQMWKDYDAANGGEGDDEDADDVDDDSDVDEDTDSAPATPRRNATVRNRTATAAARKRVAVKRPKGKVRASDAPPF